jgi:endo-1,4-beta-xylanase
MSHYRGKIGSWDVVNEPIGEDDTTLHQHIWYQAMGEDYIKIAFAAAREADPQAKLFINEYGLEQEGERWNKFLSLVTRLKADGAPIDGVGLQAHVYDIENDAIDPDTLRAHIRSLAQLGLIVRISEMDVDSRGGTEVQAQQYAGVLDTCLTEVACVSWTTWGVSDAYNMWQDDERKLQRGQDLLWNVEYQPTKAVSRLTATLTDK